MEAAAKHKRQEDILERLLSGAGVSATGFLLEPGASGSLHMHISDDVIRAALHRPLPGVARDQELLEPLWDSESGASHSSSLRHGWHVCLSKSRGSSVGSQIHIQCMCFRRMKTHKYSFLVTYAPLPCPAACSVSAISFVRMEHSCDMAIITSSALPGLWSSPTTLGWRQFL